MNAATRVLRSARWTIPAMLLAAGAAVGQQTQDKTDTSTTTPSTTQSSTWSSSDQSTSDWRRADFVPSALSGTSMVILEKEDSAGKPVLIAIDHGRVVSCQVDGQDTNIDRVQMKGDKIRVTDEGKTSALATLSVPQNTRAFSMNATNSSGYGATRSDYYNNSGSGSGYGSGYSNGPTYNRGDDRWSNGNDYRYGTEPYSRNYNPGQDYSSAPQRYSPQDNWSSNQGYNTNQSYNPNQGYNSNQGYSSNQGYNQDRYGQPDRYSSNDRYQGNPNYPDRPGYYDRYQGRYFQPDNGYSYRSTPPNSGYYPDSTYQPGQDTGSRYRTGMMGTPERQYYDTQHPVLGVMMSDADQGDFRSANATSKYTSGISVDQVNTNLPADRAGVQRGDIIVSIDGQQPVTTETLRDTLARTDFNDTLRLVVLRSGHERNINVNLSRPDFSDRGMYPSQNSDNRYPSSHQVDSDPMSPNSTYDPHNSDYNPNRSNDTGRRPYDDQNSFRPRQY